jgi:hypothetical protein
MSFFSSRNVKASRKVRVCEECGLAIAIGEPYRKWAQLFDGDFYNGVAHGDCQDWANRVMCNDEGRSTLADSDPADELDELAESLAAYPPPAAVYERLPPLWREAVDRILGPRPWPVQDRLL